MKKLLYAGIVGPPLFIVVFLFEGFTRPGYSQWRHYVSQLATGDGGWMQVVNFIVCGTLVIAFAVGLRSALRGSRGSIGGPVLIGFLQRIAIIGGWTWIAMLALHLVRAPHALHVRYRSESAPQAVPA